MNRNEGEALKKIICIDGKTMRSNKRKGGKGTHIVSAWSREDGFCLGQKAVEEKSNEITAIPKLVERIQVKGQIVTIDAMGTQKEIAETIRRKRADYVLAVKRNQGSLYEDLQLYFSDESVLKGIREKKGCICTREKAHSQIEKREYYQTGDIGWLASRRDWKGIKSIGMEEKTIESETGVRKEYRYYISSLNVEAETFQRAVRGHWSVKSMHWHLDVTFREDANQTLDKQAAQNLNIIRKWSLSLLKMIELLKPGLSMKKKRFVISLRPNRYLEEGLSLKKQIASLKEGWYRSCVCRGRRRTDIDSPTKKFYNHTIIVNILNAILFCPYQSTI